MIKHANTFPQWKQYKTLCDGLRTGKIVSTPEIEARYSRLEAEYRAWTAEHVPSVKMRHWYDSPVAARMWRQDARQIEK